MISAGEGWSIGPSGCGGEEPKPIQNNNNNDGVVPIANEPAQEPGFVLEPTRYVGPEELYIPPASARGVTYQSFDGVPRSFDYPNSLSCKYGVCTFTIGPNVQSINQNFTETPQTPEVQASFMDQIDHQRNPIKDIRIVPDKTYVLYNGEQQGIVTETYLPNGEVVTEDYRFTAVDGLPVTCPAQILPIGDQIWVSASMCVGGNYFNDGKILVLEESETGIVEIDPRVITTTQKNPQELARWSTATKDYVLVVNSGESTLDKVVQGESGIDIIDAATGDFVGNIPLGLASAKGITVSGDGKLAVLGSQHTPHLYVVDLERLRVQLESDDATTPAPERRIFTDVVLADASNPVRVADLDTAYIPDIAYDNVTGDIFVSLYQEREKRNGAPLHGRILQIHGGYEVFADQGVRLNPDFGTISANFFCSNGETQYCGELELTEDGLVALTNLPPSATFIPNERLGR